MKIRSMLCIAALVTATFATAGTVEAAAGEVLQIEVCFVLDTTGSMSGLIEGAKLKIWSIANQMIATKPAPQLKIALIGYRDRGDAYIVQRYELSEDIDAVYANLQKFQAGGGGDGPESVNQALHEAVTRIGWSSNRDVYKVIFLVGDSPPHMDYLNDVMYPATCESAVRRDLIINTVLCGSNRQTTEVWQDIARHAEGKFVAIGQTGDMQVVHTPMDKELAALNVEIGRTLTPYGTLLAQRAVMTKQATSEMAAAPAAADRLAYNARTGKTVQGGGDLVDDLKGERVKLAQIKDDQLPPEMRSMSLEQKEAFLKARSAEREKIQARIAELLKQRNAYIQEEMRKRAGGGGFDEQIRAIVVEQAKAKGIRYTGGDRK